MPEPIGFQAPAVAPRRVPLTLQIDPGTTQPVLAYLAGEFLWRNDLLKQWSSRLDIRHRMLEWSPDVAGAYEQWTYPVLASMPKIHPAPGDEREEAADQAEQLTAALRTGTGYRAIVGHLVKCPWYGFGIIELLGTLGIGNPALGEPLVPDALRIEHERIYFHRETGVPHVQTQTNLWPGVPIDGPADAWRYIVARWGSPEGHNPYGIGLAERIYWCWFFLTFTRKNWMIGLERHGMPALDVEIEAAEWETHRDVWLNIIRDFQAKGGIVRPAGGGKVSLLDAATRSFPGYEHFDETMRNAINRALLGQTLTSEPGVVGSLALGKVHKQVLTDRQWALVMWVQDTLTSTLVRFLSEYLFGQDFGFTLEIQFDDPIDATQQEARLRAAKDAKLPVLKRELYASLQFTEPAPDTPPDDIHEWPKPEPLVPGGGFGGGRFGDDDEPAGEPAEDEDEEAFAEKRQGLVGGASEGRRQTEREALDAAAVKAAAAALLRYLPGRLEARLGPLVDGAALPPSAPTP